MDIIAVCRHKLDVDGHDRWAENTRVDVELQFAGDTGSQWGGGARQWASGGRCTDYLPSEEKRALRGGVHDVEREARKVAQ